MKKAWNALVALVATMGMAVAGFVGVSSAYADDDTAQTFTISVPSDDTHSYEIYQIFTGDLSDNGDVLSNIKAGANYKGTDPVADAETIASTIKSDATDQDKLNVIKNYVDLTSTPFKTVASGASVDVPAGYYLIKDKDGSLDGKDDAYTTYIVQVVGDTEIQRKATKPTVEKKVKDVNDTTGETSDWQDSADADVNDQVEFQLTATLPSSQTDFDAYDKYELNFHDTLSDGLTFESGTVKVTVNGKELTRGTDYKVEVPGTEGATFDVNIENIKEFGVKAGDKVVVTYEAKLNANAVIGAEGNPNDVDLEYSNNPNTDGKGKTPKDRVKVFTYEVDVNKVKKDGDPLKDAGFTLYKKQSDGTWKQVGEEVKANSGADANQAVFKGLDDGDYKLVETTVPDGYNKCDDVLFTIDAEHETTSDDPKLTSLTATGDLTTADSTSGIVSGNIVNVPGSNLPETGGMGTTLLYVAGAVIVVVAGLGLAMVMRKRNAR